MTLASLVIILPRYPGSPTEFSNLFQFLSIYTSGSQPFETLDHLINYLVSVRRPPLKIVPLGHCG